DPLLHPLRERADAARRAIGEPDRREHVLDLACPPRPLDARELAVQRKDLARAEPRLVAEELRQVPDPAPRLARPEGLAEDRAAASARLRETEQELDRGRLPGAVRAEEAVHLPRLHGHREARERDDAAAVAFRELARLDRGWSAHYLSEFATAST